MGSAKVMEEVGALLCPWQLGYGTKSGSEAVVQPARLFLQHVEPTTVMMKLYFCNAFNYIHRDKILECVQDLAVDLFVYIY